MADFEFEEESTIEATFQMDVVSGNHKDLEGRDLPDQHPISAITGLETALDSKVEKTDNVSQVYGTDSEGNQTTYDVNSFGQVDDVQVDGISILENKIANLGTMALESLNDYSTKAVADTLYASISYEGTIDNHIANKENPHEVTKAQVGLGNVDNTSDLDKPISTATQTALDYKSDKSTTYTKTEVDNALSGKQNNLDTTQMAAVNSGANTTNIGQIATNTSAISTINGKIPSAASTSNQLADKNYVDNAVQTNSAHFRGNWATWADVPTDVNDYPADDDGNKTPTVNDYMVVQDASGYTGETLEGTWQFTYTGVWSTNGKNGWLPRFQINETPFTQAQLDAINSGITSGDVTLIGTALQPADITTGATNGTIAVNGTDVAVYGLGSAAYTASTAYDASGSASTAETNAKNYADGLASNYATAAQGALADTALQPNDNISELVNNSGYITGISSSDVTTALGYTPYNSTNPSGYQANVIETVKVNGTALTPSSKAVDITVPTDTGDLTNNAGFITGITSSDVTTALGYTPYDSSNPSGYTSNVGTVTSVNNVSPVSGNVTLNIPTVNDATVTIQKNGSTVSTFTLNQSSNETVNIIVPTATSDLSNDSGFITSSALSGYQTTANLVTSVSSSSTDSEYPSAKLFYDTCGDIETLINAL